MLTASCRRSALTLRRSGGCSHPARPPGARSWRRRKRRCRSGLKATGDAPEGVRQALRAAARAAIGAEALLDLISDARPTMEKTKKDFLSRYYTPGQMEFFKIHPASEEERRTAEKAWEHIFADA